MISADLHPGGPQGCTDERDRDRYAAEGDEAESRGGPRRAAGRGDADILCRQL